MPIFEQTLRRIDYTQPEIALKTMYDHIRYIQEQLEYTLTSLDSSNIIEISTDVTSITSSQGGASISGETIELSGRGGEKFTVGYDQTTGNFRFELKDKGGGQAIYMTSTGELQISKRVSLAIDGGAW